MQQPLTIDADRLLDATPDAILLVNDEGIIGLINKKAESIFGYQRHEIIGKEIEILIPAALHHKHKAVRDRYGKSPHNRPMGVGLELYAVDRNERKFPVEISLSPYTEGDHVFTIAIIRDVTQARYAEQELRKRAKEVERSNKDLEQFAMIAAHDLQAPMRQLISYCQVLNEECGDALGENGRAYTNIIRSASERMQEQISGLLEYSRVGSEGNIISKIDLSAVLKKVLSNLELEIDATKAVIEIPQQLPTISGNMRNFIQIFQNLIGNAIKYRQPNINPHVIIRATRTDSSWQFAVEDNGIGIPAGEHEQIFEIFQRSSNHQGRDGLGIGLAICKKIIERLEGQIWVDNEFQHGAKICFSLPARRSVD